MSDLTKWPRLIVVGKKVTEEQANEILLRTDDWSLHSNDREWEATVCGIAGIPIDPKYRWPNATEFTKSINVLRLLSAPEFDVQSAVYGLFTPGRERGVSFDRLRAAIAQVKGGESS